jgi:hypothetical protein
MSATIPSKAAVLDRHFVSIGARARIAGGSGARSAFDVRSDHVGEFFDLRLSERASLTVLNRDRQDRHLLLLLVNEEGEKSRFLCGHDERHWFVAAIPEEATWATDCRRAKEALQPPEARAAARALRPKERMRRRNRAFFRQGEWFFVPAPDLHVDPRYVLRNEPLRRGPGSKPHTMQFAFRRGGAVVYVSRAHPNGISKQAFEAMPEGERRKHAWRQMIAEGDVFASGRIRHSDHATVVLDNWHQVLMNTERRARAMRHVAFLD